MFTGIIQAQGEIISLEQSEFDIRLGINVSESLFDDIEIGESIATNGVCLTVTDALINNAGYYADISIETLRLTNASEWRVGNMVNLERALKASDRLGGHLVSGHVDGLGEIKVIQNCGKCYLFKVFAPQPLRKYIAVKGSICVDGVSLTVNAIDAEHFELTIIPHTFEQTSFRFYQQGSKVNLEVDTVARYLEQLLQSRK